MLLSLLLIKLKPSSSPPLSLSVVISCHQPSVVIIIITIIIMCDFGHANLSLGVIIYNGARAWWDFPLIWPDFITFSILILVAVLGCGFNGFIFWVKRHSKPSSFDLVQMNLAFSDMVSVG